MDAHICSNDDCSNLPYSPLFSLLKVGKVEAHVDTLTLATVAGYGKYCARLIPQFLKAPPDDNATHTGNTGDTEGARGEGKGDTDGGNGGNGHYSSSSSRDRSREQGFEKGSFDKSRTNSRTNSRTSDRLRGGQRTRMTGLSVEINSAKIELSVHDSKIGEKMGEEMEEEMGEEVGEEVVGEEVMMVMIMMVIMMEGVTVMMI